MTTPDQHRDLQAHRRTLGRVCVLAGPSGVGKGAVSAYLREHHPEVWISVSATTRAPRPGEVHGDHYYFIDDTEFDRLIAAGDMLEWAEVHGAARYGTPRGPVVDHVASGSPALLEIDLQGARQVRKAMPEALFVFLKAPSLEELTSRLEGRGTETREQRERRLETAQVEMAAESEFDVSVVNARVSDAGEELVALLFAPTTT